MTGQIVRDIGMIKIRRDILQIIDPESLRQRGYVGLVQSLHGAGPGVGVGAFVGFLGFLGFLVGAVDGVGEGDPVAGPVGDHRLVNLWGWLISRDVQVWMTSVTYWCIQIPHNQYHTRRWALPWCSRSGCVQDRIRDQ